MRRNPRAACRINPEGHPRNGENLRKKMRSGKEASYLTKKEKKEWHRGQLPNHEFKRCSRSDLWRNLRAAHKRKNESGSANWLTTRTSSEGA
jgi:hypothetical protein